MNTCHKTMEAELKLYWDVLRDRREYAAYYGVDSEEFRANDEELAALLKHSDWPRLKDIIRRTTEPAQPSEQSGKTAVQ